MRLVFVPALVLVLCAPQARADDRCAYAIEKLYFPLDRPDQLQQIPIIKEACRAGDTITIPAKYVYVISQLCDFGKTIFHDPYGRAVCVMKKEDN